MFLYNLFGAFWFFLPAALSNTMAVVATKLPYLSKLNYPADLFFTFNGKRVLGSHKTIRGFVVGSLASILVILVQKQLFINFEFIRRISYFDYSEFNILVIGFLLGFGALVGDSVKSFFKRQMNVAPGDSWFPFDQMDFIVGGLLFSFLYIQLSSVQYGLIFIVYFLTHPLSTVFSYFIKLKDKPI